MALQYVCHETDFGFTWTVALETAEKQPKADFVKCNSLVEGVFRQNYPTMLYLICPCGR